MKFLRRIWTALPWWLRLLCYVLLVLSVFLFFAALPAIEEAVGGFGSLWNPSTTRECLLAILAGLLIAAAAVPIMWVGTDIDERDKASYKSPPGELVYRVPVRVNPPGMGVGVIGLFVGIFGVVLALRAVALWVWAFFR